MKRFFSIFKVCIFFAMGILSGCGDSGYDDPPDDTQTPNRLSLTVALDGTQQVPRPVLTAATGTAELVLDQTTGVLSGNITVSNPSSTISAAHIHQAIAGTNNTPFLTLIKSEVDDKIWNVPPNSTLSESEVESLLAGGMYINVHTANHPGGEVRGQIVGSDTEVIRVKLTGANEVPSVDSIGDGVAFVTLNKATAEITAIVHINNLIATNAHIHQAFAGNNGASVITLTNNSNDSFIWESSSMLPEVQLSALLNGEMYINVHTATNPSGEIRGQIAPAAIKIVQAELDGSQQTPDPVSTNGSGTGYVTVNTATGDIYATLRAENLNGTISNAHIHQAAAGSSGGVAVPLVQDGTENGLWKADDTLSGEELQALLRGEMYFNVHSSTSAAGEIRGQILVPSFSFIQQTVLNTRCISCHGAGASGGLRLDNETYAGLVLQASNQNSGLRLVTPGDPDNSYLIQKLEGNGNGSQMPPTGDPLEQIVIDNIRNWIAQGAEHN